MDTSQSMTDMKTDTAWFEESDGQLAIDVYQTETMLILKAPIAGVAKEDLEVAVTDEVVTIKGRRHDENSVRQEQYFMQECFWGSFTRSYVLPVAVDADQAQASLKDGILTIMIPKLQESKTRMIQVQ